MLDRNTKAHESIKLTGKGGYVDKQNTVTCVYIITFNSGIELKIMENI